MSLRLGATKDVVARFLRYRACLALPITVGEFIEPLKSRKTLVYTKKIKGKLHPKGVT